MIFAGAGVFALLAAAADVHFVSDPGVGRLGIRSRARLNHEGVSLGRGKSLLGNQSVALPFESDFFATGLELGEDSGGSGAGSGGLFVRIEEGDGHDAFGTDQ